VKEWIHSRRPSVVYGTTQFERTLSRLGGENSLIVTSPSISKNKKFDSIKNSLLKSKVLIIDTVRPNPTFESVDLLCDQVRLFGPKNIIAVGGGSVIDFSKTLSALVSNPGIRCAVELLKLVDYQQKSVKLIAVPTTAGTGSEVTPFATLWDKNGLGKSSIESQEIMPDIAVLDREWISSAPHDQLLYSGLDAISHCIETLWNKDRSSVSETYAVEGLRFILSSFPNLLSGRCTDDDYRSMQIGAMFGGRAISESHTALAHAISYPLTAHFGVPHGLACSFTIPAIFRHFEKDLELTSNTFDALRETIDMLDGLKLHTRVLDFISSVQIQQMMPLVADQSRSKNFAFSVDLELIKNLVIESLDKI
jgi:alcohol dehydrogenase